MKKILILIFLFLFSMAQTMAQEAIEPEKNIEYLNMKWWEKFGDENLVKNLLVVYENNYDLKNAALKVKENEKIVKMQFASQLPFVNFSGSLVRDMQAAREQFGDMAIPKYSQYNYNLPITAAYEIDIWGQNRLKTKSAEYELEIVKEMERATYIALTSNFAADYFNLIKADKLLEIQNELIDSQEKIVSMVLDKYNAGLCPVEKLLVEEKLLASLKEEKNNHKLTKDVLEESIKTYLVNFDGQIKRNAYENVVLINNIIEEFDTNVVENRPDFKQQEANIKKMGIDVKIAKKELLPKFTIMGQVGLNAYRLGSLFNKPSQFLSAGILPSFSLFSGGYKMAFLKYKKYQYEEAINNYQKTILDGIKEVNSSLLEYKTAKDNYIEAKNRLDTQKNIYKLAQDKNDIGASSNLDTLYAKEAYLLVEKEEVANKINSIITIIGLFKASGGIDLLKENI